MVDLSQYLPILIFLVIAIGLSAAFGFLPMGVARLTGAHNPTAEKLSEYECGFPAFEDSRSQFDVRFYLVAILNAGKPHSYSVSFSGVGLCAPVKRAATIGRNTNADDRIRATPRNIRIGRYCDRSTKALLAGANGTWSL